MQGFGCVVGTRSVAVVLGVPKEFLGVLARLPVDKRTVGKTYMAKDGNTFQPSMLITLTLGSAGAVHTGARTRRGLLQPCECGTLHGNTDPLLGTPIDPDAYDYRQAACDAIFFASALDRFWQNMRRAAGLNRQYAGTVEMQRRLAPHAHFACAAPSQAL